MTSPTQQAVAKRDENQPNLIAVVQRMIPEIRRALPHHLDADRIARLALTVLRKDAMRTDSGPRLADCTPDSFAGALLTSSALGLEPGVNGEAYLVPYGRECTFFDGPIVTHVSAADMYDPVLRGIATDVIREHGIPFHERGTIVIINGPRFSTKSESKWFSDAGWEVISMTQYPEAYLCRELAMAVVNIALITDYDAGVLEGTEAVDARSVLEVFAQNAERIQKVVLDLIGRFPADLDALGARDALGPTRGDGHVVTAEDVRLFETGL